MYYAEVGEWFNPVGSRPIVSLTHAGSKTDPFYKKVSVLPKICETSFRQYNGIEVPALSANLK